MAAEKEKPNFKVVADNRRARYYRVTAAGRRQLEREIAAYRRVSAAIALILRPA